MNNTVARENKIGKGIDIWYMVSKRTQYTFFSLVEEQSTIQKLIYLKPEKQITEGIV